jgi:hypothetical protein
MVALQIFDGQALSTLHSKYQSERHLEEVVIINRLISRESSKQRQNQKQDSMMICNTDRDLRINLLQLPFLSTR